MKPHRPQPPNRAEHKITGEVLAASQILTHPSHPRLKRPYGHEDYNSWRCPGCKVQVFPRAWDGKQRFKKTAYFTASPGEHKEGCKPEHRDRTAPTQGRDPRTPTELVSHLILTPASRGLALAKPPLPPGKVSIFPWRDGNDHHARSERCIAPICEDFTSGRPGVLDALLRIDRSPSQPYRHWFVHLGTGGPDILGTKRIFFGELCFTALPSIDWGSRGPIRIPLHSFVGRHRRHLFIDVEDWPEASAIDLRNQLTKVMQKGQAAWQQQPARPYVFLLTEEMDSQQTDYHVRSEACVFAKLCVVPELGRQSRRYLCPPRTHDEGNLRDERLNERKFSLGQERPAPGFSQASETISPCPAAAFTQDASHIDNEADDAAEPLVISPDLRGNLLDSAELATESTPPVVENGDVIQESPVPKQVMPSPTSPATQRPVRPTAQPPMPWYRRIPARIAKMFRDKPDPSSQAPPTISGTRT